MRPRKNDAWQERPLGSADRMMAHKGVGGQKSTTKHEKADVPPKKEEEADDRLCRRHTTRSSMARGEAEHFWCD